MYEIKINGMTIDYVERTVCIWGILWYPVSGMIMESGGEQGILDVSIDR